MGKINRTCKENRGGCVLHEVVQRRLLIPENKVPTFAEFSNGWWNAETCNYVKWRQLHNPMGDDTISLHKGRFDNHIIPYFSKYRLDEITSNVVEDWLLHMSEKTGQGNEVDDNEPHENDGKTEGKKLKHQTINLAYRTFKLMMAEAMRTRIIKENPCADVKELKVDRIKREILTVEEVRKLFMANWVKVWGSEIMYTINRLAACTGLRIGELTGLKGEFIFDDYIYITGQYTKHGYKPYTKTKENRNIPISSTMRRELEPFLIANGNGFIFSENGGKTPINGNRIRYQFDRALLAIGISPDERVKRKLTFHSWRHFLNTLLRMSNVADSKVQSVTGHRSMKMTDHYTHFDTRQFTEVRDVQTELLTFNEPVKNVTGKTVQVKNAKSRIIKTTQTKIRKAGSVIKKPVTKATIKKPVKKPMAKKKARA